MISEEGQSVKCLLEGLIGALQYIDKRSENMVILEAQDKTADEVIVDAVASVAKRIKLEMEGED